MSDYENVFVNIDVVETLLNDLSKFILYEIVIIDGKYSPSFNTN